MEQQQEQRHTIVLAPAAQHTIYTDICERKTIEACGILLGSIDQMQNWHVQRAHPLTNSANSPVYFEFPPEELMEAELQFPGEIIGVYHSHPTGYPRASDTDRRTMQRVNQEESIPWAWLIVCGPFVLSDTRQNHLSSYQLIAYHHFAGRDLWQLPILLENTEE